MDEKIIVLVSDKDDSKHGEISILDDPRKAERLVETLLEAGFDESRIRVFNGRSSEFEVNHRPIVALVDKSRAGTPKLAAKGKSRNDKAEEPAAEVESHGGKSEEPAAEVESHEEKAEEPAARLAVAESRIQEQPEDEMKEEEEATATAQVAAPVRFSALFRSA